mgnify:CR=1 FL=1
MELHEEINKWNIWDSCQTHDYDDDDDDDVCDR